MHFEAVIELTGVSICIEVTEISDPKKYCIPYVQLNLIHIKL